MLLLAVGCGLQTETYHDNLVMPLADGSPDSLFFSINVEYVADGIPAPAKEQINAAIVTQAFDLENGPEVSGLRYRKYGICPFCH